MIIALQTLVFFRESLFAAIDRLLRPYYKHFSLTFNRHGNVSDDEESEDHVFAEFDDEKGVVFFPPMYAQRYAAVSDCLMDERWCGQLEKVVDFGYHDMSFIKYLKEVPGIKKILGVDIESIPLRCSSDLLGCEEYVPKRENPLQVILYQGNAADPDYRLIGCDAVIAIEMIEHMLPHDLERIVHTIFGFIKPRIAVITTPNGDFNPLFKALEKNGLRRLDHFFEWSREQFHDWCSNIVVRYPQYTVSCRGVGPGPQGTIHYGCCSQLALFVAKDYHKQQDLNLNSLALVPKVPSPFNVCEMIGSIDSPGVLTDSNNMLCSPNNMDSYTELVFSDKQSCVTIMLSPSFSLDSMECRDNTAQCNLDKELGKNFLFDEEPCFGVLWPRRKNDNRVYVIEDVNSRLNCTTLQVKKFSKITQNMLARNRIDSLGHTREVVDEIKHLTKMLNFKNEAIDKVEGSQIWNNINWGDNAPYWNQYYKIVREYNYPFEAKTEEGRILDLISDEINRLIDSQYEEDFSVDANKLEIPLDYLMRAVQHITNDVEKVKDLMEWNGYEIVDGMVIYSRLVLDNASLGSPDDEWHDNDTFSEVIMF
ncbi:small RNA 2'-O-methyltransferase [Ostrinia nubilalis]|uniref:small RNA 2'-O-methyltransferase n=1 Tax=Ostrinia nubilalis TaxID=29057 RepID=UPI0030823FA3